jgi:dTDP-4-amino-4,6-dideoxygalactose transaminase
MNKKIWLSSPHMSGQEQINVNDAFDSNWIAPLGPYVNGFEEKLASFTGANYAAALSSGTAALHLALILSGVKAGDTVICPSFTFSASANPIVYMGAKPVFVDSELSTWNLSPILLRNSIIDLAAKGMKPAAIIIVHLYGMPASMNELMAIANKYDIPVIEDAAESLGGMYHGKHTGTFGKFGVLSFNGNKIITTSGGGALISNSKEKIDQARFLATQARDNAPHYQHSHIGYNYRMSNICAAIGCGQMTVLNDRIQSRRSNFEYYKTNLKDVKGISFLDEPVGFYSNRWLSCIIVDPTLTKNNATRETIRLHLETLNIECRPLWKPMHLQPIFENELSYVDGTCEALFENGLCLPSGSSLTTSDLDFIISAIKNIVA